MPGWFPFEDGVNGGMKNFRGRFVILLMVCVLVACRSARQGPDLAALYGRAASQHDMDRNPVIVIPGILGSKLVDSESGRTVWGAFGGQAVHPKDPADARLTALPMALGVPLAELRDTVYSAGVLENVELRLAGLPFELQAYVHIMQTLGVGGYRDPEFYLDSIRYGEDHFTCFQFDYDWRRDIVENARRLAAFVHEKKAYITRERRQRFGVDDEEVKFDVIAHSMGGLMLRYFLRYGAADLSADRSLPKLTWEGARYIDRAIFIAPPNAGAVEPFMNLVNGRRFAPLTPIYQAALLGTFPGIYGLMPRPRHEVIRDENGNPLDFLDAKVWEKNGWGLLDPEQGSVLKVLLPEVQTSAERRRIALDHVEKTLERTRQFYAALDVPAAPPAGTTLHLIAGDAYPTPAAVAFRDGELKIVDHGPGDGKVLRSSALMDERQGDARQSDARWSPRLVSPIHWSQVTFHFSNHLGITRSPSFSDNLLYLLLEAPESPSGTIPSSLGHGTDSDL